MFRLVFLMSLTAATKITSDDPGIVIDRSDRLMSLNTPSIDLDLSGLGLRSIDPNAFVNCTLAKSLNLSNNSIHDLVQGVFMPLTSLEHLSLANNDLGGQSTRRAFIGLVQLKSLNVTNNRLARILDKDNFAGLTKSCDIFIGGSKKFRILSPLAFGRRKNLPSTVAQINDQASTIEEKECPVRTILHLESHLDESRLNIEPTVRVKLCTVDNKVQSVDLVYVNESLPKTCERIGIESKKPKLMIVDTRMKSFERGWFRIPHVASNSFNSIYLHHNRINELTSDLLNDLPENIKFVSVQRSELERLNKGVIVNEYLRGLDLSQNAIDFIEEDTFARTNLTHLNLGSNNLKILKFTMTLPASLLDLNLELNEIDLIPADSFSRLRNLLALRLCHNNITELQPRSLSGLESLQFLDLCFANLAKLQPDVFRDLGKLRNLDLYGNELSNLDKGVFNGLGCLGQLDLNSNKLARFDKEMLHGLSERLDSLYLHFNELESLGAASFVKIPKSELWMGKNKISNIDKDAFDLPYLRDLSLVSNNITRIAKGTMKNVGCLADVVNVQLTWNPIKRLENGALAGLPSKAHVDLGETPIEVIQAGVFEDL